MSTESKSPVTREEAILIMKDAMNGYEPQKGMAVAGVNAIYEAIAKRGIAEDEKPSPYVRAK